MNINGMPFGWGEGVLPLCYAFVYEKPGIVTEK
jgi:hypothetical protein